MANPFSDMIVRVDDLLEILRDNKESHDAEFHLAVDLYRNEAIRRLEARVDDIKQGRNFSLGFGLPEPKCHADDYDRAITMLQLTKQAGEETVMLTETEAAQFVMNQWGWIHEWTTTNAFYTGTG